MKERNEDKVAIFGKSLCRFSENRHLNLPKTEEINTEIERLKEQNFVNLMVEIIVSLTLRQLDEEGD